MIAPPARLVPWAAAVDSSSCLGFAGPDQDIEVVEGHRGIHEPLPVDLTGTAGHDVVGRFVMSIGEESAWSVTCPDRCSSLNLDCNERKLGTASTRT